jgi:proline iminopeptidase
MRTSGELPIEYDTLGNPGGPAIVLIMGLGMQLTSWPEPFCQALADAGFRVVRFDNRDSGLSARVLGRKQSPLPLAIAASLLGLPVRCPYTLQDMAHDAIRVMDALQIDRAHMVGASMGGMIAQVLAAKFPQRVLSLTSIMSSSGNRRVSQPSAKAQRALLSRPKNPRDPASVVEHLIQVFGVIGSPAYPEHPATLRQRIAFGVHRAYDPAGTKRQLLAVIASGDRRKLLHTIKAPTLVIHGAADPLVPLAAGRDTAANITGATLQVIEGMGHDLPSALLPRLAGLIVAFLQKTSK